MNNFFLSFSLLIVAVASLFGQQSYSPLSSVLENKESTGSVITDNAPRQYIKEDGSQGEKMFQEVVVNIENPGGHYNTTIFTFQIETSGVLTGNNIDYNPMVKTEGCIETKFMSIDEIKAAASTFDNKMTTPYTLLIVTEAYDSMKMSFDVRESLKNKRIILGWQKAWRLDDEARDKLQEVKLPYFENLDIPQSMIDDYKASKASSPWYAFKFVFSPFQNASSLDGSVPFDDDHQHEKKFANLADVVLFKADDKLFDFCTKKRDKITLLNYDPRSSNQFPMGENVSPPKLVKSEKQANYWLHFSGETGTHIVAPYRFNQKTGSSLKNLPANIAIAPCSRIKIPYEPENSFENSEVTKEKIGSFNPAPGSIVLIDTGYGQKRWSNPKAYMEPKRFPVLTIDAAKYLVEQLNVAAIGIDSPSLDYGEIDAKISRFPNYAVHGYLADKNIPVLLNVNINDTLFGDSVNSRCVLSYFRMNDGYTSPVAIFTLPGYDPTTVVPTQTTSAMLPKIVDVVETPKPTETTSTTTTTTTTTATSTEAPSTTLEDTTTTTTMSTTVTTPAVSLVVEAVIDEEHKFIEETTPVTSTMSTTTTTTTQSTVTTTTESPTTSTTPTTEMSSSTTVIMADITTTNISTNATVLDNVETSSNATFVLPPPLAVIAEELSPSSSTLPPTTQTVTFNRDMRRSSAPVASSLAVLIAVAAFFAYIV